MSGLVLGFLSHAYMLNGDRFVMAFFAHSPESQSPFTPPSPMSPNAITTQQMHQRIQFLTRRLEETIESRDYYANLYYSTKQKLEATRSSLQYVMQHLKFIGNQVTTVASQVEGDNLLKHKSSSQYTLVEDQSLLTSAPLKSRTQSLSVDSIPSKGSSTLQKSRRKVMTPVTSSSKSDESSPSNLEYKSYKGISSNEFIELCQQLSDPDCPFSYLQLTNCRMGSVEVMETFCYNLGKNTSLVELSLTNVGIKLDSLVVLLRGLQKIENIRVLRLQYNKIGEDCFNALKNFLAKAHLMFLDLKGNPIEDSHVKKELEKLCCQPGRCIIKFQDKPATSDSNEDTGTQL